MINSICPIAANTIPVTKLMTMKNELTSLLAETLKEYEDATDEEQKLSLINDIIYLTKKTEPIDWQNKIYKYNKWYINHYVKSRAIRGFNYDNISIKKLYQNFKHLEPEQREKCSLHAERVLSQNDYNDLHARAKCCTNKYHCCDLCKEVFSQGKLYKIPHLLFSIATMNIKSISICLLLILIVVGVSTSDSSVVNSKDYIFYKNNYSDSYAINHVFNCIALLFNVDQDVKLIPITKVGIFWISFYKVFMLLFFFNIFINELGKKVSAE